MCLLLLGLAWLGPGNLNSWLKRRPTRKREPWNIYIHVLRLESRWIFHLTSTSYVYNIYFCYGRRAVQPSKVYCIHVFFFCLLISSFFLFFLIISSGPFNSSLQEKIISRGTDKRTCAVAGTRPKIKKRQVKKKKSEQISKRGKLKRKTTAERSKEKMEKPCFFFRAAIVLEWRVKEIRIWSSRWHHRLLYILFATQLKTTKEMCTNTPVRLYLVINEVEKF